MGESIYDKRHRVVVALMIETRKKAGLRQVDVAEQLTSKNQQLVSGMESGQRRIDIAELHAYCDAVNVNFLDFMSSYYDRARPRKAPR